MVDISILGLLQTLLNHGYPNWCQLLYDCTKLKGKGSAESKYVLQDTTFQAKDFDKLIKID